MTKQKAEAPPVANGEGTSIEPAWLSVKDTIKYSGVSRNSLYTSVLQHCTTRKLGRRLFVNRASVDRFLNGLPALPPPGKRTPRGAAPRATARPRPLRP